MRKLSPPMPPTSYLSLGIMTLPTESGIASRVSIQPSAISGKSDYHFVHFLNSTGVLQPRIYPRSSKRPPRRNFSAAKMAAFITFLYRCLTPQPLAHRFPRVYSLTMSSIQFGTDGWRGVIAEDFTFAKARAVAAAIARYVVRDEDARKGVLVGYDHRFASDRIAAAVAEVISSTGTP